MRNSQHTQCNNLCSKASKRTTSHSLVLSICKTKLPSNLSEAQRLGWKKRASKSNNCSHCMSKRLTFTASSGHVQQPRSQQLQDRSQELNMLGQSRLLLCMTEANIQLLRLQLH